MTVAILKFDGGALGGEMLMAVCSLTGKVAVSHYFGADDAWVDRDSFDINYWHIDKAGVDSYDFHDAELMKVYPL